MIKAHLIAAARPNFMKVAPLYHALRQEHWAEPKIVHTGQHYDHNMSDGMFVDLGLPDPHVFLGVGSGTHAEQTGKVMIAYEKVLSAQTPDLVVVVGDVNSTMAASVAASKLGIKVAHLEAGLRSFDRRMPEDSEKQKDHRHRGHVEITDLRPAPGHKGPQRTEKRKKHQSNGSREPLHEDRRNRLDGAAAQSAEAQHPDPVCSCGGGKKVTEEVTDPEDLDQLL